MNEPVPQPNAEARNAQEATPLRRSAAKDLSLINVVPKWGGAENASPIEEFFDIIEGTARIGNWTEADQIQVCALRLTDSAREFYRATPELKDPTIKWEDFKAHFTQRFRDVRTSQFHFTELQQARQRKHESPRQFLDRCRILAQRTVPCVTDVTLQRAFREQAERMLVAAYTAGLTGAAGREVRLRAPETTGEAVRIATTVEQAELQERRNDSFYMDSGTETTPAGKVQERPGKHANTRSDNTRSKPPRHVRTQNASDQQPIQKARSGAHVKCYECSGYGHYAKDCANRRNRAGASNAEVNRGTGKKGHDKGRNRRANHPAEN